VNDANGWFCFGSKTRVETQAPRRAQMQDLRQRARLDSEIRALRLQAVFPRASRKNRFQEVLLKCAERMLKECFELKEC
jgi:hypothetical protein